MTVKIYRPEEIKDANLASSTLPEPDASRGEVEWQDESQKRFRVEHNPQNGSLRDIIYIGGIGTFVLYDFIVESGGQTTGPRLLRLNGNGQITASANIPTGGQYRLPVSLSYTKISQFSGIINIGCVDRLELPQRHKVTIVDYYVTSSALQLDKSTTLQSTPLDNLTWAPDYDVKFNGNLANPRYVMSWINFNTTKVFLVNSEGETIGSSEPSISSEIFGVRFMINDSNRIFASNYWTVFRDGFSYFQTSELDNNFNIINTFLTPSLGGDISGFSTDQDTFSFSYRRQTIPSMITLVYDQNFINIGAYKSGDEVIVKDTHKRYRAIKNAIFTYPPDNSQDGGDWIEVGPTNRWVMFDGEINTKSRSESGHTVNLTPSYLFDSVSVFGCKNVTEVRLTVRNSANAIIFQRDEDMNDLIAALEWQQDPLNPDLFSEVTIDGIPTAAGAKIELQFIGSNIEVGLVTYGLSREIGESLSGLSQNYFDYSKVEYNDFGKLIYLERPIVKLNTYNVLVEREKTRSVDRLINSYRGQNLVWSGSTGNGETLVTYGRAQRSPLVYEYPNINELEITVRGSI